MTDKHRIRINYLETDMSDLMGWLEANNIKYALVSDDPEPYDPSQMTIGTLTCFVEVYSEEHETAVRLKCRARD